MRKSEKLVEISGNNKRKSMHIIEIRSFFVYNLQNIYPVIHMSIALSTTIIVSFISSIIGGALPLWRMETKSHHRWMHHLDALCDGVFIAIALTHLLPELYHHTSTLAFSGYVALIAGMTLTLTRMYTKHEKIQAEKIAIYLLLGHCFFEGLAVSIAKCQHVQASLSAAILAHKLIESFVFLNLISRHVDSRKSLMLLLPLFAALTPIGIVSGMWLISAPEFVINLTNALTCGAFISLGTSCFLLSDCHEHDSISKLWAFIGFSSVYFIL